MSDSLKVAVNTQQRLSFVDDPLPSQQADTITITARLVDENTNSNNNANNSNSLNPNTLTLVKRPTYVPNSANQLQVPNLMERRQSQWNTNKRSVFSRRLSQTMSYGSRKSSQDLLLTKIRYQNTYRLEPDDNTRFYAYKIEPRLYATMEHALKNCTYDAKKCPQQTKELSEDILRETRNCLVNSSRYKLVSHIVIGQLNDQDIRVASRCLWDTQFDNFICVTYKNKDLYAVVTLFAVYYE